MGSSFEGLSMSGLEAQIGRMLGGLRGYKSKIVGSHPSTQEGLKKLF